MKKLLLATIIAAFTMLSSVQANDCCCKCPKKKVGTEEVSRCYFCEKRCFLGCERVVKFVEITYETTYVDCCDEETVETWTKVKRCGVVKCCDED